MGSQAFFQKKSSIQGKGFKHDRGRNPYADVALLHDLVTIESVDEIGNQTPISNGYTTGQPRANAVPIAMKLRLPSRLVQALLTTCAAALATTSQVYAAIPEDYTQVIITCEDDLSMYTESESIAFILAADIENYNYRIVSDRQYWTGSASQEQSLTFNCFYIDSQDGGVLWVQEQLDMNGLKELNIGGNNTQGTDYSSLQGGAVYGEYGSNINFIGNETVTFANDEVKTDYEAFGGAISGHDINMSNNDKVYFDTNVASATDDFYYATSDSDKQAAGGAIYTTSGSINITKNIEVDFIYNNAVTQKTYYGSGYEGMAVSCGGALYGPSIDISGNGDVMFRDNFLHAASGYAYYDSQGGTVFIPVYGTCGRGGAIYGDSVNLSKNETIVFQYNNATASGSTCGGAIYGNSISLIDNGSVTFKGNRVYASYDLLYPPASADEISSYGGALYGDVVTISGNDAVNFDNNFADTAGGAIYAGSLSVTGNGHVEFRRNYEYGDMENKFQRRLRGVYLSGSALELSAGAEQDIVFYDTLTAKQSNGELTVSFNAPYQDSSGVSHSGAGDIVFSGIHAAEDLQSGGGTYTQQELVNSLTSEVYATTNLYGGRLRIEDGAVYKGNGINVVTDSGATLALRDATLAHSGYDIALNATASLSLEGVNAIVADHLMMGDGSAMQVKLGDVNAAGALLTLSGDWVQSGHLDIDVTYSEAAATSPMRILDTLGSSVPQGWKAENISVNGTTFDKLQWSDGILYLNLTGAAIPDLPDLVWNGGDKHWNYTSENWLADGSAANYVSGAKVHFGNTGAGTITLEGLLAPRSIEVDSASSYTWNGSGKITGGTKLSKGGTGTLTINTINDYAGGTKLTAGTLVMGSGNALGSGDVYIEGGTLDLGGYAIQGERLHFSGAGVHGLRNGAIDGAAYFSGGDFTGNNLTFNNSALFENAGTISFECNRSVYNKDVHGGALQAVGSVTIQGAENVNLSGRVEVTVEGSEWYAAEAKGSGIYGKTIAFDHNGAVGIENNAINTCYNQYENMLWRDMPSGEYDPYYMYQSIAQGGAIFGETGAAVSISNNKSVSLTCNEAFAGGSSMLDDASTSSINAVALGGAIYVGNYSKIQINDNETVEIKDNSAGAFNAGGWGAAESHGGAIYAGNDSTIEICRNDEVTFAGNYAQRGSSIYIDGGSVDINNNGNVLFSGESETGGWSASAAISVGAYGGSLSMCDNKEVVFNRNINNGGYDTDYAGAISLFDDVLIRGNDSISFIENIGIYAGAIYASHVNVSHNGIVTFSNNEGVANYSAAGAINAYMLSICDNHDVSFIENRTYWNVGCGTIYGNDVQICGNDNVVFKGNILLSANKLDALTAKNLSLYAGENQTITFYDPISVGRNSYGVVVEYNGKREGADGETQFGSGDIIFSGAFAAEYAEESVLDLEASLTSEVYATTNLYGGRLRVEDGAIYKGKGINVAENSGATLLLANGSLEQAGYDVVLNAGTILDLTGENNITASSLVLKGGSSVKLAEGTNLNIGETMNLESRQASEMAITCDTIVSASKISATDGMGLLENVNMSTAGNYTIENMTISGSLIDVGENTTMYLVNVEIKPDTRITDEAAWLDMEATHGWLDERNASITGQHLTTEESTLYLTGKTSQSLTMTAGSKVVELTSSMFDSVTLTGTDLWLDMQAIAGEFKGTDYVTLDFRDLAHELSNAQVDVDKLQVYATLDGEKYLRAYSTASGGLITTLCFQVPEPATGTLSLLALAALAARRRRK